MNKITLEQAIESQAEMLADTSHCAECVECIECMSEDEAILEFLKELKVYRETNFTPEQLVAIKSIDWDNVRNCAAELIKYTEIGYTPEQVQELHDNNLNSSKVWIPCSERMPERGVGVHVYAKRDDVGYQFDAFVAFRELRWYTYDSTKLESLKSNRVDSSYEITHWMPYPEPPSEK